MRKSFSIFSALLATIAVALCVSQYLLMRENSALRREIENVRSKFGYIQVDDPTKVYLRTIQDGDKSGHTAYRLHFPKGNHYLLHLSHAVSPAAGESGRKPITTISLNGWKGGMEVILKWTAYLDDNGHSRLQVSTETDTFIDHTIKGSGYAESVTGDGQISYLLNESIELMKWRSADPKDELKLWLEPAELWHLRNAK